MSDNKKDLIDRISCGDEILKDGEYFNIEENWKEEDDSITPLKYSFEIVDGKLHGLVEVYQKKVTKKFFLTKSRWVLSERTNYKKGKKHGKRFLYYKGFISNEQNYNNGKRDGEQYTYSYLGSDSYDIGPFYSTPNGQHRELKMLSTYKDGVCHGKFEEYRIVKMTEGFIVEKTKYIYKHLSEWGDYVNDKQDGMWYSNPWDRGRNQNPYKNGMRHGRWTYDGWFYIIYDNDEEVENGTYED